MGRAVTPAAARLLGSAHGPFGNTAGSPSYLFFGTCKVRHISQNQRIVGIGGDFWRCPSPTPPKQFLTAAAQESTQGDQNISMEGDPTSLAACTRALPPSQHRSSSSCPYGTPWAPSVRGAPRPGAEHHGTEPGPILLTPPFRYRSALIRSLPAFPSPGEQPRGSQPVPIRRCCRPPPSL